MGEPSDGWRSASSTAARSASTASRSAKDGSGIRTPISRAYAWSASMTCPIILSRSRPPPRGPLRSSAGERSATRSKMTQAASTRLARRSASAFVTRRRSSFVIVRRDAEVGATAAADRFDDAEVVGLDLQAARARLAGRPSRTDRGVRSAPRWRDRGPCPSGTSRASRSPRRTPSSGRPLHRCRASPCVRG